MNILSKITKADSSAFTLNVALLFFRLGISAELIIVHGLKKIGVGTGAVEAVPNPFDLPETFNFWMAASANLFFPVLVMLGLFTRLSVLPILAVTLTGYFIVHGHDSLLERDIPYVYSLAFLFLLIVGPGKYSLDYLFSHRHPLT